MFARSIALAALVVATVAGASPQQHTDIGTPTGAAPRSCINTQQIREQRVIDDRTILFRVGKAWYRNDIPSSCIALGSERAFSYRTSQGSQLCAVDIITVINPSLGMSYGSCGLGKFTPVELAKK